MRKEVVVLTCLFMALWAFQSTADAQTFHDINKYIENPEMYAENQEPAHVPLVPFLSTQQALENDWSRSSYHLALDGNWKFHWATNPYESPENFYEEAYDVSRWDDIKVPSVWQTEGYGWSMYRNIPQAFRPYDPPHVPDDINPVGSYRRTFTVPEDWSGRQVFLHFDGVKSASFVWVNGKYVGYDQGGMTASEYNVTRFVRPGQNIVAVKVFRWSDGSYLEDQDMWRFSGMYRSAYLFATPVVHIRDFFVRTDLDGKYEDADLLSSVWLHNYAGNDAGKHTVELKLYDDEGNVVSTASRSSVVHAGEEVTLEFKQRIKNPLKWSAEKPNLYKLTLELKDEGGNSMEVLLQRVGFREIAVIDGVVKVNGVPVEFRGVNRHEHHPEYGRTMPVNMMKRDFEVMKQFNVNAIRLCHYPNDPKFYALADEYGLYIEDEVNTESHYAEANEGGRFGENWFPSNPAWQPAFFERFERMLQRDKNHPSIVLWSTGNETGTGPVMQKEADYAREVDGTRLIMHQSNHPTGDAPYVDILGPRYESPEKLRYTAMHDKRPVVQGEYMHAMGNSVGNFDEFWEIIRQYPNLQGGFIWDWVDQGLSVKLILTPDGSRNKNDGAVMGNPTVVDGKFGKAIALSGLDDFVELYDHPNLDITGTEVTVETWIYPRNCFARNPIVTKGTTQFRLEQLTRDSLHFAVTSGQITGIARARIPGDWDYNWHHVAGIYDGKEIKLVIDGKVVATHTFSGNIHRSHFPVGVGKNIEDNGSGYPDWLSNSVFDNVRIYARALKLNELGYHQQEPAAGAELVLDFDEFNDTGKTFWTYDSDPFCINGTVFPDRSVQPETWQVKRSQAPVRVKPVDLPTGKVRIINYHHFTDLNELSASWKIEIGDRALQNGILTLNIPPGEEQIVTIPFTPPVLNPGEEAFLTVAFSLPKATRWAEAGHEVAFDQFRLPFEAPPVPVPANVQKISLTDSDKEVTISGENFVYKLDKTTGSLASMQAGGKELLALGPKLTVYRPAIPNEMMAWGHYRELKTNWEAEEWWYYGFDEIKENVQSVEIEDVSDRMAKVRVETLWNSIATRRDVTGFQCVYEYTFTGNGEVQLDHTVIPFGDEVNYFQRIGVQLRLPQDLQNLEWYGRGPFETYPDRKTAAKVGVYKSTVDEQYVPYVVAQEHGNKTDVRWVKVTNEEGAGLVFSGDELLGVNVSNFDPENIDRARYGFQLKKAGYVTVNLDHKASGVGDTPVPVRWQYRTRPHPYEYSITIRPVSQ